MSFLMDIGIAIATMKVARFIDSATELRQEQLTQAQLQNEITRLKMELAEKETVKTDEWMPTQEEVSAEVERLCKLHGC